MGLAFVPVYIKYLGIEAYGLIGIFAILQSWLTLLDMGMTPALSREMARFTAGAHNAESIRDLLRSLEMVGCAIAAAIALGTWACSGWLAVAWLKAQHLPIDVIVRALSAMGVVAGLRFIENIYAGSVVGLQRQVVQNVVTCVLATVRAGGAVAILAWVSPTIEAFFLWQCLISLVTIPTLAALVYGRLPRSPRPGRFSIAALRSVWRFAAGMLAISALSLLLTQADKILLSRLLNLTDFGYYAFAGLVANTLYFLAAPVNAAFYPRFTELATRRDEPALRRVYHQAAQLLSVTVGSVAVVLIVFCNRLLLLWTGDPTLVQHVAPLLVILTAGTLLNALMGIPYQMQLAYGWTSLTIGINLVAVALLVPAVFWAAPRYGAIGAAWVWVMLNVGYLIFMIYFMQRRILKTETWGWYRNGLVFPLLAAMVTALLGNLILPSHMEKVFGFLALVFCSACVLLAACLAAPIARRQFARFITAKIWPSNARH